MIAKSLSTKIASYNFLSHPGVSSTDVVHRAVRSVRVGEEVFNDYGEGWFASRKQVEVSFIVPLTSI